MLVSFGYALGLASKFWGWQHTGQFSPVTWIYAWNLFVTAFDAVLVHHYARPAGQPNPEADAGTSAI